MFFNKQDRDFHYLGLVFTILLHYINSISSIIDWHFPSRLEAYGIVFRMSRGSDRDRQNRSMFLTAEQTIHVAQTHNHYQT